MMLPPDFIEAQASPITKVPQVILTTISRFLLLTEVDYLSRTNSVVGEDVLKAYSLVNGIHLKFGDDPIKRLFRLLRQITFTNATFIRCVDPPRHKTLTVLGQFASFSSFGQALPNVTISMESLALILLTVPRLSELHYPVDLSLFCQLRQSLPNITSIWPCSITNEDPRKIAEGFQSLARYLPNLTELYATTVDGQDEMGDILSAIPQLQRLGVDDFHGDFSNRTPRARKRFITQIASLRNLHALSLCLHLNSNINTLVNSLSDSVQYFRVSICEVYVTQESIAKLSHAVELHVVFEEEYDSADTFVPDTSAGLVVHLNVVETRNCDIEPLARLVDHVADIDWPQLQVFHFHGLGERGDAMMKRYANNLKFLGSRMPQVESVSLLTAPEYVDTILCSDQRRNNFPRLKSLSLRLTYTESPEPFSDALMSLMAGLDGLLLGHESITTARFDLPENVGSLTFHATTLVLKCVPTETINRILLFSWPNLKALSITHNVTSEDSSKIYFSALVPTLTRLERLKVCVIGEYSSIVPQKMYEMLFELFRWPNTLKNLRFLYELKEFREFHASQPKREGYEEVSRKIGGLKECFAIQCFGESGLVEE
eukprot:39673_1